MSEFYGVVKTNSYDGYQSVTLLAVGKTKLGLMRKWNKSPNIDGNGPKEEDTDLKFGLLTTTRQWYNYNRSITIRLKPVEFPFIEKKYYVYRDILGNIK